MAAAAHTKGGFGGVSQSVGREFNQADKGHKFKEGGTSMATKKMDAESKKEFAFMKANKAPKSMIAADMKEEGYAKGGGIESRGKTNCKMVGMKKGGRC